jgi:chromate reductase
MTLSIAVIVGSLRKESINRKLAHGLVKLGPPAFAFTFVPIGDLPLYNQDFEDAPSPAVTAFREAIKAADALLIVSPEYNRSMPGVLKNAIDIGSRPFGKSVWGGKPCGIMGASPGALSTAAMQQHLRNTLSTLDVLTTPAPEVFIQVKDGFFDATDGINEGSQKFLQGWMNAYAAFVTKQTSAFQKV